MPIRIEKMIPAIRTQSLLRIMSNLDSPDWIITDLKATATRHDFNQGEKGEVLDIGVNWHLNVPHSFFQLDFSTEFDEGKPIHPLDALARRRVREILETVDTQTGDAAVTLIKVLFTNKSIQKYLDAEDDQFSLIFIAEEPHGVLDRNTFEQLQFNKDLVKFSGFKTRILNCKYMVTRTSELSDKRANLEYIIHWPTRNFRSLSTNNHVALLIRRVLDLTEPIGALKTFVKGTDRDLAELVDVS